MSWIHRRETRAKRDISILLPVTSPCQERREPGWRGCPLQGSETGGWGPWPPFRACRASGVAMVILKEARPGPAPVTLGSSLLPGCPFVQGSWGAVSPGGRHGGTASNTESTEAGPTAPSCWGCTGTPHNRSHPQALLQARAGSLPGAPGHRCHSAAFSGGLLIPPHEHLLPPRLRLLHSCVSTAHGPTVPASAHLMSSLSQGWGGEGEPGSPPRGKGRLWGLGYSGHSRQCP